MLKKARKDLHKILKDRAQGNESHKDCKYLGNDAWDCGHLDNVEDCDCHVCAVRYWIGTDPDPAKRRQITVSAHDSVLIVGLSRKASAEVATVKDLLTGQDVTVRRASCGLDCFCALEFVPISEKKRSIEAVKLVNTIARMQTEEEFGEDSPPSEDWIGTLNDLILSARKIADLHD